MLDISVSVSVSFRRRGRGEKGGGAEGWDRGHLVSRMLKNVKRT